MSNANKAARCVLFVWLCCASVGAKPIRHYVFFGQDREIIKDASSFLETKSLEGAQVTYSWRQLEPGRDEYDFSAIREDLAFLSSRGKRLFIQIQDVTFSASSINVPRYLLKDPQYNGGADKQYSFKFVNHVEENVTVAGWMARRWDPAVQERFHKLLFALGKEFDGRVEGVNLAETAFDVGDTGKLFPKGFTFEGYRDGIITNMKALRRAFPRSVTLEYANFMPGEWLPTEDRGYLRSVYEAAKELRVGVGGPDLLPYKPGQMNNSYPLIRASAPFVPVGVAVQDGNYQHINPKTGERVTIPEIVEFARDYLKVDYVFWCTQEPYFSGQVIPFFRKAK